MPAIQRWKLTNATPDNEDVKPNLGQYDTIITEWQSKDKVAKFLGIYSSKRFYSDWKAAEPTEATWKAVTWEVFI